MIRSWVGVLVLGLVCVAGTAKADPDTHDGFQFRGVIGGGYLHDSRTLEGSFGGVSRSAEGTAKGGAGLFELYFGGTPVPGLVFGGYLSGISAPGPTLEDDQNGEVEADDDFSMGFGSIG